MLNELAQKAYQIAKAHGFHEEDVPVGVRLMLIVSELGEALEADRKGLWFSRNPLVLEVLNNQGIPNSDWKTIFKDEIKDMFEDEIADALIRILDLSAKYGIDLDWHVQQKMRYNEQREFKHGKAY